MVCADTFYTLNTAANSPVVFSPLHTQVCRRYQRLSVHRSTTKIFLSLRLILFFVLRGFSSYPWHRFEQRQFAPCGGRTASSTPSHEFSLSAFRRFDGPRSAFIPCGIFKYFPRFPAARSGRTRTGRQQSTRTDNLV